MTRCMKIFMAGAMLAWRKYGRLFCLYSMAPLVRWSMLAKTFLLMVMLGK
ncbi:hypothetical protein N878_00375 [Pseudomonas sp. EGD-AK9]|nr:hypothetical protein N878_00375 [Pseudomonas sp. EGD-AK9]